MKQKNNKEYFLTVLILLGLTFIIFWQFFLRGLYPFPGDFLLAWYEPWKSSFNLGGTITIPHKPIADDVFRQIFPFKVLASDIIKHFSLPLWNPYNGAGMPLLATMHVGFLTPFNSFFIFLPGQLAWALYIMIQPFLIGLFTYLFCRKIGLSFKATIFSALTFILSGFVITRLIFGEYIYTLSMLPLILYLIESYLQNNKNRLILLLPPAILFLFISGQPQIILYVLVFSTFYLLYRWEQVRKNDCIPVKKLLYVIILFLIGFGLSAIQLLPTLELFSQAGISPSSSKFIFDRFLLPSQHLITIIIPNYFGNQATYNYWGTADYIETVVSIGLIPIFFAFLSFEGKRKMQLFFFSFAIISILSTLNWFGAKLFFSIPLPIISTGAPSRIFAFTTFSISILAGYGFDNWASAQKINKQTLIKVIIFILILAILLIGTFSFYQLKVSCNNKFILDCRLIALRNTLFETAVFSIGLILFFLRMVFKKESLKAIAPFAILLLIIFLGIYNSTKFLPFSPKSSFLPENNLIKFLISKTSDGRVFGFGEANIKTDFATYFRFFDPNYYDPLYNKRYGELISYANSGKILSLKRSDIEIVNNISISDEAEQRRFRLLNMLGIKYLVYRKSEAPKSQEEEILWEDDKWYVKFNSTLPHVYLVNDFQVINSDEKLLERLFSLEFNPKNTVLLEKNVSSFLLEKSSEISEDEKVTIVDYHPNKVSLKSNTLSNHFLVISDNYFPGWKAYIDGEEKPIYRANYTFRAIEVPKGVHKIEFSYQPQSLKLGIIISFISFLLLIYFFLKAKKSYLSYPPKIKRKKQ